MRRKLSLSIVVLCSVLVSLVKPQPGMFDKGAIFVKQADLKLATAQWVIVLDINYGKLIAEASLLISQINSVLNELARGEEFETGDFGRDRWKVHISAAVKLQTLHLRNATQVIHEKLIKLKLATTLATSIDQTESLSIRKKRGLVDFGGKVLNFLFGSLDSDDLRTLNKQINALNLQVHSILHLEREYATILNNTVEALYREREILQLSSFTKDLAVHQEHILNTVQIMNLLQLLSQAFNVLQGQVLDLEVSIESASRNRLSPLLVSPMKLAIILSEIKAILPPELSLLDPEDHEDSLTKYANILVIPAAIPGKMRLFLRIPLASRLDSFNLYKIISLPTQIPETNVSFFVKTPFSYIGVSQNLQNYFLFNDQDLGECTGILNQVCPLNKLIYKGTSNSCEWALFQGQTDLVRDLCAVHLISKGYKIFLKIGDDGQWIFSLSDPLPIVIDCTRSKRQKTTPPVEKKILVGNGNLVVPPGCIAQNSDMRIPIFFQGVSSSRDVILDSIYIPPVDMLINNLTKALLRDRADLVKKHLPLFTPGADKLNILDTISLPLKQWNDKISKIEDLAIEGNPFFDFSSYLIKWGIPIIVCVILIIFCLFCKKHGISNNSSYPNFLSVSPIQPPSNLVEGIIEHALQQTEAEYEMENQEVLPQIPLYSNQTLNPLTRPKNIRPSHRRPIVEEDSNIMETVNL